MRKEAGRLTVVSSVLAEFSNKLVQAPFCERPKTAPRTLFLSFANNNCFDIDSGIASEL
jgi:hypothetical protein